MSSFDETQEARPKKILLPVDFTPCSEAALAYALRLGEILEADIDVLHVWEPGPIPPEADLATIGLLSASERAQRLKEWLMAMEQGKHGRTRAVLETGDPTSTILELAGSSDYDLIVMGTNGRSGVRQILQPSVAERVVRRAPCPVLTVRTGSPASGSSRSEGDVV